MAPRSDNGNHGLRNAGDDAFQLTVDYLKQETIEPLQGLGRFLYMGIAGSFFLAAGLLLVLIGILRLLQTETGSALTGDWSWVPYAVVVILGVLIMGIAGWRITAGPGQQKLPAVMAQRQSRENQAAASVTSSSVTPVAPPAAPQAANESQEGTG
jgi:TRAP-type C4-dicarboxylate transport system permease large subunit